MKALKTREMWFRVAAQVKEGEAPFKTLKPGEEKAAPAKGMGDDDESDERDNETEEASMPQGPTKELFGEWQTEAYVPPVAVDGKVPRNREYGDKDIIEATLDSGTQHIPTVTHSHIYPHM